MPTPLLLALVVTSPATAAIPAPPPARREIVRETLHGVEIADPYRWLEDQDAPETRAFIAAQEAHCRAVLDGLPQRRAAEAVLQPLYRHDEVSVPWQAGDRLVFSRRRASEQLPSIVVRDSDRAADRVLVDAATLSPDGKQSARIEALSDDGSVVVIGVREGGADEAEIRFLDALTGKETAERLPAARYMSVVLMPDLGGAWYSVHDGNGPLVREHRFGTSLEADPVIFGKGLPAGLGVGIDLSPDGKWLVATVWHGSAAMKSEIHVKPAASPAPFRAIVDDVEARFSPMPADGVLFVQTNWNAPNGRILAIDLSDPRRETWKEIVPESRHPMQEAGLAGGRICARYLENVRSLIRVYTPAGRLERVIEPATLGFQDNVSGRWRDPMGFIRSSSWTNPQVIERVRLADGSRRTWFETSVALPLSRFVVEQHWCTSSDGARLPIFLGRSRGAKPDGTSPALVVGYGGFNLSQLPGFSPLIAAWLSQGGIVALPALRGGGEFGETWHEQAMGERKQQTFDDLYAATEWLVKSGWAAPDRVAVRGRSNGGLLVGAAITQRPGMFRAAVCGYPLLDMVRYHQFLVARFWVPEYGSSEDPGQFRFLRAYSPYHNVKEGEKYPAVMFVTGDADTRVAPLHARKMAALLQASSSSGHPVLLHYDEEMGHVGGLPADKELADAADELAFLTWQLGLGATAAGNGLGR